MRPFFTQEDEGIAGINVTPIIDVALVLVIILLITAPMLTETDMQVTLPTARTRGPEDEARITITLNQYGEVAIDNDTVMRREFENRFRERMEQAHAENLLVIVRADAAAPYKTVREVLNEARDAGANRIAIATEQKRGSPR